MILTLGRKYKFDVEVREYDGSKILTRVEVHAKGYTAALEAIQEANLTDSDCLVKFVGEEMK